MNKYEYALSELINISLSKFTDVEEVAKHQATLQHLIDSCKKKPVVRVSEGKLYDNLLCPKCYTKLGVTMRGEAIKKVDGVNYCRMCGQRLVYVDEAK